MPIFSPKMSLFYIKFVLISKKKWSRRIQNGGHSSINWHLTQNTPVKKNGSSKNTFWGHIPIFLPERSTFFFRDYNKLIEEFFERKKSGCHLSNNGYLTHKTPPKPQKTLFCPEMSQRRLSFGQILSEKDVWSLKTPICKSVLLW